MDERTRNDMVKEATEKDEAIIGFLETRKTAAIWMRELHSVQQTPEGNSLSELYAVQVEFFDAAIRRYRELVGAQ